MTGQDSAEKFWESIESLETLAEELNERIMTIEQEKERLSAKVIELQRENEYLKEQMNELEQEFETNQLSVAESGATRILINDRDQLKKKIGELITKIDLHLSSS